MTQDEIIEMAIQAKILEKGDEWVFDMSNAFELTTNQNQLKTFAKLVEQRTWVGLTDEEIFEIHKQVDSMQYLTFGKAIEAKLKEKNT